MEKGVTYPDLDIFVSVGLGSSNESIIEGWSVRKSKHNRFVITPTGYLLNIFTMLPILNDWYTLYVLRNCVVWRTNNSSRNCDCPGNNRDLTSTFVSTYQKK